MPFGRPARLAQDDGSHGRYIYSKCQYKCSVISCRNSLPAWQGSPAQLRLRTAPEVASRCEEPWALDETMDTDEAHFATLLERVILQLVSPSHILARTWPLPPAHPQPCQIPPAAPASFHPPFPRQQTTTSSDAPHALARSYSLPIRSPSSAVPLRSGSARARAGAG